MIIPTAALAVGIFCLNSKSFAELKEPNRTTGAAQRRADFLKLCDAVTVKPLVTRYTTHKNTAAEYICGCVLCSVAHCCVDWIWRDNISPDLTWVILSATTLAVCLADMSASPLRSLNMAFSIYLPYRFSAIYFSAMWTATAPSATAVTT